MKTALSGAELLFWTYIERDRQPDHRGYIAGFDKHWLCLRESYFDLLLANGHKPLSGMIQLMVDAQKVNGPT